MAYPPKVHDIPAEPSWCTFQRSTAELGQSYVSVCVCRISILRPAGDPIVKGFDGCSWYMKGQPGSVVNLVTEANHVVNSQLIPANLTDDHHKNDGTFHGAISMRFRKVVVVATVDPEGNLTGELPDSLAQGLGGCLQGRECCSTVC